MRRTMIVSVLLAVSMALVACAQQSAPPARNPQSEALLRAAREGNADTVKALLSSPGADVNAADERGSTPLIEAARYGHDTVARTLLAAGANTNHSSGGETPSPSHVNRGGSMPPSSKAALVNLISNTPLRQTIRR